MKLESVPTNKTSYEENSSSYNKVLTVPNIISFIRLCLVPVYLILLFNGFDIAAFIVFAIAAISDCLDGQVARRCHQVSRLGKLLDPAIDTILMITGVLGVFFIGRVPFWIVAIIIIREAILLIGGGLLLRFKHLRVDVIYPGKVATTLLFSGFAGMILNFPLVGGLSLFDSIYFPGFGTEQVCLWIWLIYIGLILQICVTVYYFIAAWKLVKASNKTVKTATVVSKKDL